MKVLKGLILAAIVTLLVGNVPAQEGQPADAPDLSKDTPAQDSQQLISTNYTFSIQAGVALEDMSVNTTDLIAPGTDNINSPVRPIGFFFRFEGITHTSFSANGNGIIRLGTIPLAGTSEFNQIINSQNAPRIMPYWDDLCVGDAGKVHYKRVGISGNSKLVIEWKNMKIPKSTGCFGNGSGTFQLWLFEHTGIIQFVYGSGIAGTASNSGYSVGMGNSGNFASITTAFGTIDYVNANDAQTNPIAEGTAYLFTPSIVAAPTGGNVTQLGQTSLQLNWTDAATNETGYQIRRSLTGSELEYVPIATLPANSTSFSDSGLQPNTQYFYLINAISDSAVSQDLLFQPTTLPPNNAPSTATGGLWSSPSTWANGSVPLSQDNVTIAPGATVIIDTAAVAGNVTVGTAGSLAEREKGWAEGGAPAVLQFGEAGAFSLTVAHNVTIGSNDTVSTGAGNGNQHVLSVGGDLINNGTLDLSTNNNTAGAGIVFTGASNNTFGGTGAVTDIRTLTIDKGTTNANILDLTVSNFTVQGTTSDGPASGYLFLNKGTFKISGTFTGNHRTFASPAYQVVAAAGFWLNNPNYTVASQGDTVAVLGSLRVSAGTYNVGTAAGNSLLISDFGRVIVEGGAINITGRFGAYNNSAPLNYSQSGGKLTTCTIGHISTTLACFDLGTNRTVNTSIVMTGGDIVIEKHPPIAGAVDYRNEAGSGPEGLVGTNVYFGSPLSGGPHAFTSLGWLPNVHIDPSAGAHTLTFLTSVQGNTAHDMYIPPGSTVNIGNALFILRGNVLVNHGTIIAQGATANFIFGRGPESSPIYSGSGSFAGLTEKIRVRCNTLMFDPAVSNIRVRNIEVYQGNVINANKLTLGNNDAGVSSISFGLLNTLPPTGTFDTAPIFELGTGGQSLSYLGTAAGTARTIGPELNPTRTLFNLADDDAGTLTFTGGDITVTNTLTLTRGQVVTGSNKVIVNGGVFRTNGYVAGTVKWRLTQPFIPYVFPVGMNGYTPVTVEPSDSVGTYVTVTPVDETLPGLLPATAASRYFTVLPDAPAISGRLTFTYLDSEASGNEANYKLWRSNGGAPVLIPGSAVFPSTNRVDTGGGFSGFTGNWGIGTELNTAPVSISGSVTQAGGQPIPNATVTISGGNLPAPIITQTGSFGLYQFTNLQAGETYTVRVDMKRFRFSPNTQQVTPTTDVTNVNFVANPQ